MKAMKAKTAEVETINPGTVIPISADELFLDPKNPRLTGENFGIDDQTGILSVLWKDKEVSELVDSIAHSGYWKQEVLYAAREGERLVVVEGNRRLSAVKLLRSPETCARIGAKGVPTDLSPKKIASYDTLPVIECTRKSLWQYMGFKHLNGPQEWDSIAKAEYVARVHEEFDQPLSEIAGAIGDRHATVRRMYQGLTVLRQADKAGVFRKENAWGKRFPYSHLWTGLGYDSVRDFLGIKSETRETPNPVPAKNIAKLGDLCSWLFGSKEPSVKPLIKSQNPDLRKLSEVLASERGYAALKRMRESTDIDGIWRFCRGDETNLRESLVAADKALRESLGYLPTVSAKERASFVQQGQAILKLAEAIMVSMRTAEGKEEK